MLWARIAWHCVRGRLGLVAGLSAATLSYPDIRLPGALGGWCCVHGPWGLTHTFGVCTVVVCELP